jgi:hypothetical protein
VWSRLLLTAIALPLTGTAAAQPRPAALEIGSWVLSCARDNNADPCHLRHRTWILPPDIGGPTAALEVLHSGNELVPVIAVRGLSMQAALGTVLALQANVGLRFETASRIELSCGLDGSAIVCAPMREAAATAASQLVSAHSVLVQAQIRVPGVMSLPEQSRAFDLQHTQDALARLRAAAPASKIQPALPGLDWRGFLERLLRDAGLRDSAD